MSVAVLARRRYIRTTLVCTLLAFAVAISFRLASDQQLAIEEV
jgi:hypothetical protein